MKIFDSVAELAAARDPGAPRLALAIGNFDGVHRGHQAVLAEARVRAERRGGPAAVLTFSPHPARFFAPDKAPPLIMPLARRLELFAASGIDLVVVEPFTAAFAAVAAEDFVEQILARELGAGDVVVGYDFSFGRGRAGTVERLAALGAALGIGVAVIPPVIENGAPCSSTRVRQLVAAGDARGAAALLGRPFELIGPVVRGAARGRTLGFPTANVAPEGELLPRMGIYAAQVRFLDDPGAGSVYRAALSIGRNPTFTSGTLIGSPSPSATSSGGQSPPPLTRSNSSAATVTVEAHLLDFGGDLYERRVRVELVDWLRDEQRFDSVDALIQQIQADVAQVRGIFA